MSKENETPHEMLLKKGFKGLRPNRDINIAAVVADEYAAQQTAQKDAEIVELNAAITKLQEKYDENGYAANSLIKLQRIEQHIDMAIDIYRSRHSEALKEVEKYRNKLIDAEIVIDSCLPPIKELRAALIWQNTYNEPHILGASDAKLIRGAWEQIKDYKADFADRYFTEQNQESTGTKKINDQDLPF